VLTFDIGKLYAISDRDGLEPRIRKLGNHIMFKELGNINISSYKMYHSETGLGTANANSYSELVFQCPFMVLGKHPKYISEYKIMQTNPSDNRPKIGYVDIKFEREIDSYGWLPSRKILLWEMMTEQEIF